MRRLLAFSFFLLTTSTIQAHPTEITYRSSVVAKSLSAEEENGRVWLDETEVLRIAKSLGAEIFYEKPSYRMVFSDFMTVINPEEKTFSTYDSAVGFWQKFPFRDNAKVLDDRLLISLDALPSLLRHSFRYHRQKKLLEDKEFVNDDRQGIPVDVRFIVRELNTWISVADAAQAVNARIVRRNYRTYRLITDDFTTIDIKVGENTLIKNDQTVIRLDQPALVYGGSLYITARSLSLALNRMVKWDPVSSRLFIQGTGSRPGFKNAALHKVEFIGYEPTPVEFDIEEIIEFYQTPAPVSAASNDSLYDSLLDENTGEPLSSSDRPDANLNGSILASLRGAWFSAPLDIAGHFERVGTVGKLVDGSFTWGFPWLKLAAGREFMSSNDLYNQYIQADRASISHHTDPYGDRAVGPDFWLSASLGQSKYDVFLSSTFFSKTAKTVSEFKAVETGVDYKFKPLFSSSLRAQQRWFENSVSTITSDFQPFEDLYEDLTPEERGILIGNDEADGLLSESLAPRHQTTTIEANVKHEEHGLLQLVGAQSAYDNETSGEQVTGNDLMMHGLIHHRNNRLEASIETIDANYRSVGDPDSYRNRRLLRVAPQLNPFSFWTIQGERRRERPYRSGIDDSNRTSDYWDHVQTFQWKPVTVRGQISEHTSQLSGLRRSFGGEWTQRFGRQSINGSATVTRLWDTTGRSFKTAHRWKAGSTIALDTWRFSFAQEFTKNRYETLSTTALEIRSNIEVQVENLEVTLKYESVPYSLSDRSYLHTGELTVGQTGDIKNLSFFFATSSLQANLTSPLVWRLGARYGY